MKAATTQCEQDHVLHPSHLNKRDREPDECNMQFCWQKVHLELLNSWSFFIFWVPTKGMFVSNFQCSIIFDFAAVKVS